MATKKTAGVLDAASPLSGATEQVNSSPVLLRSWLAELCDTLEATGHVLTVVLDRDNDGLLLYAVPQEIET